MDDIAIVTFPGNNGQGSINVLGANPGDIILSVASISSGFIGLDLTSSFMREVQFLGQNPVPTGGPFSYVVQTDNRNFSAEIFVAVVRRKKGDRPS